MSVLYNKKYVVDWLELMLWTPPSLTDFHVANT